MSDINVRFEDMPGRVHSFLRENPDDSYTILINARLSAEMQQDAYLHEIDHMIHHDCDALDPADQIEQLRHK